MLPSARPTPDGRASRRALRVTLASVTLASVTSLAATAGAASPGGAARAAGSREPSHAHPCTDDGAAREAFLAELAKVEALERSKKWAGAREGLLALLETHRDAPYVLARAPELEALLARCAFWAQFDLPQPKEVVGAKKLTYNPGTGVVEATYDSCDADFESDPESPIEFHPAYFDQSGSIEVRGDLKDSGLGSSRPMSLFVWVNDTEWYEASVYSRDGAYRAALSEGPSEEVHDVNESAPVRTNSKYRLRLTVTAKSVTLTNNGQLLVKASRDGGPCGQFGLVGFGKFDELIVEGRANTSWIEGELDTCVQAARTAFEAKNPRAQLLPAWLHEALARPAREDADAGFPDASDPRHAPLLEKLARHLRPPIRTRMGLRQIEKLTDADATPAFRAWLTAVYHTNRGDYRAGLDACAALDAVAPGHASELGLRGRCYAGLGRFDEARVALTAAVDAGSVLAGLHESLVELHIEAGDLDAAAASLERSIQVGAAPGPLQATSRTLMRARRGPDWRRSNEYVSPHYRLRSDLDRRACVRITDVLEESLATYNSKLGRLTRDQREVARFEVLLFSGQAGFLQHTEDLLGEAMHHTAGLYSPLLRTLVLWNLPSRDELFRTVRHEALHQYLDQRIPGEVPIWLNEGLAGYFETAKVVEGQMRVGLPNDSFVASLGEQEWIPASEFFTLAPAEFYEHGELAYAQAWAIAHYLLEGPREAKAALARALERMTAGEPAEVALGELFNTGPASALLDRVSQHIAAMR